MIVYIWKKPLKIEWWFLLKDLEEQMKIHWITILLPVFEDKQKAIDFYWEDWFFIMGQSSI